MRELICRALMMGAAHSAASNTDKINDEWLRPLEVDWIANAIRAGTKMFLVRA